MPQKEPRLGHIQRLKGCQHGSDIQLVIGEMSDIACVAVVYEAIRKPCPRQSMRP